MRSTAGCFIPKDSNHLCNRLLYRQLVMVTNGAKSARLLADENDRAFGSGHATRTLDRDCELIDARDVLGQLDPQIAVARLVRPTDARRDRRFGAADCPDFEALPMAFDNGREI